MARKRYTTEQIIGLLREAEVRFGQDETIGAIFQIDRQLQFADISVEH